MPVLPSAPPPSDHHGDPTDTSLDEAAGPKVNEERRDGGWSPEEELEELGGLDRKWLLWSDFMKDHAHLETWLRLAEQAVTCASPAHITYVGAKEKLRRVERLRWEAGPRLVQSDSLTLRNRTLARLFRGDMRARLLALARSSGQRCDAVMAELESAAARLKFFVAEWEEFEAEGAELSLWLADLDARLTEVDHLTGNTCRKLQQLQMFQQRVCVNAARLNDFLRRGETLIQRCEAADARHVEGELLHLLRRCSRVSNNIAQTHTRLMSMRLVFEDDHLLSQAPDSGCPSESLLEEEGAPLPVEPRPPEAPPSPDDPVLEWDPSVDVGHSRHVCRDDADSSYFSTCTGVKRRSYLSSLSDISGHDQEPERSWLDHAHSSPSPEARWATSTPESRELEALGFDGGRVRAWLGVQSPAPNHERTSCSRAVQTENEVSEDFCCDEEQILSELGGDASMSVVSPTLLFLLLAAFLLLLACLCWKSVAHRHRALMPFSVHLMMTYVNGAPPT